MDRTRARRPGLLRRFMLGSILLALFVAPNAWAPVSAQSDSALTVSAAADLTPAFEALGKLFEERTGVAVDFNFGSTGHLTQQIEAGAPVDVFAAANVSYIDQLDAKGLILPDTKAHYARGRIVIWTRADSPLTLDELLDLTSPDVRRIAIANPDHAPYGVAAREALQTEGLWDAVQDKLIFGENIAATLRYAQTGDVDVAIVALSLSIKGDGKWTLLPEKLHQPLNQALAVIAGTTHETEARAFATFVNSEAGREVMRGYGFILPGETLAQATPMAGTPVAKPAQ